MAIDPSKYGAKVISTNNPLAKYGATLVSTQQPSTIKQWTGIEPKTYLQESWENVKQFVSNPIKTIGSAISAGVEAITGSAKRAVKETKDIFNGGQEKTSIRFRDYLEALSADVGLIFSPISSAFAAAEKIPVLKQAADIINIPFTATGKVGEFSAGKFVDVLPINKEDKDILKPAFEEVGTLAGQLLLGGKVMRMIEKGIGIKKSVITEEVKKTKVEAQQARTILEEKVKVEESKPSDDIKVYHGSPESTANKIKSEGFSLQDRTDTMNKGSGISFSTDKSVADKFKGVNGETFSTLISKDAKLINGDVFNLKVKEFYNGNQIRGEELAKTKAAEFFKANGYDGIDFTKSRTSEQIEKEIRIWNLDKIKQTGKIAKSALDTNRRIARDGFQALPDTELAKYDPITIKGSLEKVAELLSDRKQIEKILSGEVNIESGLRQPFFNAVEKLAIKTKDINLREKLVSSPIATERSLAAQELGSSAYNMNETSPVKVIKDIQKVYTEKATKNAKVKQEILSKDKVEVKNEVRKLNTKETWASFVKSIQC
jgi:hypothetical protein